MKDLLLLSLKIHSRHYLVFNLLVSVANGLCSFSERSERSLERVSNREMHRAVVFPIQVVARRAPLRPRVLPVHPRRVVQLHTEVQPQYQQTEVQPQSEAPRKGYLLVELIPTEYPVWLLLVVVYRPYVPCVEERR